MSARDSDRKRVGGGWREIESDGEGEREGKRKKEREREGSFPPPSTGYSTLFSRKNTQSEKAGAPMRNSVLVLAFVCQ